LKGITKSVRTRMFEKRRNDLARIALCGVACVLLGCVACGTAPNGSSPATGFAALSGKRLPGTSSDWIPISSPFDKPVDVATTIAPPTRTVRNGADGSFISVAFFDFGSPADATAFYELPPIDARLNLVSILAYEPLAGETGVPPPARGLDLRSCVWEGGDNEGAYGTRAAGQLSDSGECSLGHASSIGVGTLVHRGTVVVIIENTSNTVVGGHANPRDLSQNTALASAAVQLLHHVGLA
jgi:hypothetical protein